MRTEAARFLLGIVGIYAAIGVAFGIVFLIRGVGRVDAAARGSSLGFRAIIAPGVIAVWPFLAWRWLDGATAPPAQQTAHDCAASGDAR